MTKLTTPYESVYELQLNDEVFIGDVPYFVKEFTRGGMGLVVFLERDDARIPDSRHTHVHGPRVALKMVLSIDDDPMVPDLFFRELTVWAGLNHPNIVKLNEILQTRYDGWVAAMDWTSGSLKRVLERNSVNALQYAFEAHAALHLDLKPANILNQIDPNRMGEAKEGSVRRFSWKVADWGLASVKSGALSKHPDLAKQQANLATLNNIGTVSYMAPERFTSGVRSSISSDVFSLGLMLYEMVIGELPYQKSNPDLVSQICSHSYFSLAQFTLKKRNIPKNLVNVILQMIAPKPSARYTSYQDLLDSLNRIQHPFTFFIRKHFDS